jgi:uncharacterized membrane protein
MGRIFHTYNVGLVGITIGMAILIYGVLLTAGESLNVYMVVGGLVILGTIALMTYGFANEETVREYGRES